METADWRGLLLVLLVRWRIEFILGAKVFLILVLRELRVLRFV